MSAFRSQFVLAVSCGLALVLFAEGRASAAPSAQPPTTLDCAALPCSQVLPGASQFVPAPGGAAYKLGKDAAGELVGWVVLSTDVVDVRAYSGKPLVTVIGLRPDGTIAGARVVHHSEPIILVGIPEQSLHDFVDKHVGLAATARVTVGATKDPGSIGIDVVSGATVTVLAQNQTIMESARALGQAVGVIHAEPAVPGHFVVETAPWSWEKMVEEGAFGRIVLSEREMGLPNASGAFIDLYFTVVDAPHIGEALLGPGEYAHRKKRLQKGEHMLVVLSNGSSSFKGSGFVRGGIFDRIRLEQGLGSVIFRDADYANLDGAKATGAPSFKEGALFVVREGKLDPGQPFSMVFLGSRYNQRGGFSRDFQETRAIHRLPKSMYVLDGPDPESRIWRAAWQSKGTQVVLLGGFLLLVAGVFAGRRVSTAKMGRLQRLHVAVLLVTFFGLGLALRAQPSITQLLTAIGSLVGEWRWGLFLSEPLLFVFWIFIALVTLVWGRGVFCGWACAYGALSELLFKLGRVLKLPSYELPDRWHDKARYVRYGVLAGLVVVFLYSPALGEQLAEIEPFKTTFFVKPWARPIGLFVYWLVLLAASLFVYRPFCRYLCPLGAALALPSSVRVSGPYRRVFCSKCTICTKGCEPRAIRANGTIDPRECLSCMECEANFRDEEVCPPLVGIERLTRKVKAGEASADVDAKLAQLHKDSVRW